MLTQIGNPPEYKAALYIRISKEDGGEKESESVINQRSMLLSFARQYEIGVFDIYIDDGYSGTTFERPGFRRMLGDIEAQRVNMVITKDMSRLGRDYIQTGYYLECFFPEKQVRYISILDGVDTGVEGAVNDITPFKAIMNDMYARDISKKITSVKRDKQKKGLFIGGKAPYGYVLSKEERNKLSVDGKAAPIVREMFRMALNGASCRRIAMYLNENNVPSPSAYAGAVSRVKGPYAGLWSSERVTSILKNQIYAGDMVQGRTRKISYKLKKCRRLPPEEWTIVPNTHEALVGREDFNKVQLMIASRRSTRDRTYDYLLKGLIFCHECGYPLAVVMRTLSGNRPALYTVCRTYQRFTGLGKCTCHCIRVETVTEAVVSKVKEICRLYLEQDECVQIASAQMAEYGRGAACEKELRKLAERVDSLTTQLDQVYTDKLTGLLDETDFQRVYPKIKAERARLWEHIEKLESKESIEDHHEMTADDFAGRFIDTIDDNRELIVNLIEKVELSEDKEIRIYFRFKDPGVMAGEL